MNFFLSSVKLFSTISIMIFMVNQKAFCEEKSYRVVSLIQLIATPDKYVNKYISVQGYYGGIPIHLYLTKDHADIGDYFSAIQLVDDVPSRKGSMPASSCRYNYIMVNGLFLQIPNKSSYIIRDIEKAHFSRAGGICWKLPEYIKKIPRPSE